MHMAPDSPRDADAANRTCRLQSRSNVCAVAMKVGAVRDHVAYVDADAEADAEVRWLVAIIHRHLLLYLTAQRHCRVELSNATSRESPPGLDYPPHRVCELWDVGHGAMSAIEHVPASFQDRLASCADHVGVRDGDRFPASVGQICRRGQDRRSLCSRSRTLAQQWAPRDEARRGGNSLVSLCSHARVARPEMSFSRPPRTPRAP